MAGVVKGDAWVENGQSCLRYRVASLHSPGIEICHQGRVRLGKIVAGHYLCSARPLKRGVNCNGLVYRWPVETGVRWMAF